MHNVSRDSIEMAKVIITLRSGKEVPRPEISTERQTVALTSEVAVESDEAQEKLEEVSQELKNSVDVEAETSKEYRPVVPYPQRLVVGQKNKYYTEIQEIFKQKLRDPGSPTVSIMISESRIGRALLYLGSSVNLLPFSIYEQLGLGELKKTSIVLQLADRLVKVPRGVIEDVLVQVNKFYYLVDFVVLDMHAFENDSPKQPDIFYETVPLSRELTESEGQCTEIDGSPQLLNAGYMSSWCTPSFEALDLPEVMKSSEEEVPTLELKPLPKDLKYAFIGPYEGTFHVVISSHLTLKQETELLQVLRHHRGELAGLLQTSRGLILQSVLTTSF
ncbi:uncharacterized protein LOC131145812 [Malania oleifera]|uniref:uncharacterized protein LOC131145812 n=1 Tax=Malania oleifera TaxID=397392 RepID=UPI0025AE8D18|nr:uncharacterized protein LOC131145812 [Malania oleifera]